MSQYIIYSADDGTMAIIIPCLDCGLTIEQIAEKDVPSGKPFKIVDAAALPVDRAFRNAWRCGQGNFIEVDMPAAREVTKERLRAERAPLLQALDVAFQRALESGADTSSIVAEKQRLRDFTKLADAASDVAALKGITCT